MDDEIIVSIRGRYGDFFASAAISPCYSECFEPLDSVSEISLAAFSDKPVKETLIGKRVVKLREDAAEKISMHLTRLLIQAMESRDTQNGY